MPKFNNLLVAIVALSAMIMFTGCQNEPNLIEPQENQNSTQLSLSKFSIPAGATFESATFYIYVEFAGGQDIDVHRITNPWEACEVTFGGSYATEVVGTFNASTDWAWYSCDVSSLVGGWLDGTYPNYGLLLNQVNTTFSLTT